MEGDQVSNIEESGEFISITECQRDQKVTTAVQAFTMAQIINYFIEAVAGDKEKTNDFKSLRESSYQMFKEGHVQKIELKRGYETIIIKCNCLPEMRKDRVYKIIMRIHHTSGEIQFAKCGCVAGKGPRACCKHIASVCYALENFSRLFLDEPEEIACTDLLQKWNQPRKRRLSPKKISELNFSIESHNKVKRTRNLQGRKPGDIIGQISENDVKVVENLKSRLESFQKENPQVKLSLLSVLNSTSPSNRSLSPPTDKEPSNTNGQSDACVQQTISSSNNIVNQRVLFKESLNKTSNERMDVFQKTQMQSECNLWFEERRGRITGSVCGRIINRNPNIYPKSLLKTITRTSSITTAAMAMGKQQVAQILARYLHQQPENGNSDTSVQGADFLIDKEYGCLGASPVSVVTDNSSKGCAEIKAAVSLWDKSITEL